MWRKEEKVCFSAYGLRLRNPCVKTVRSNVVVLLLQEIHVPQE